MTDPKTVLPGALTAADLLPYERLALKMARQQLGRGENPPPNTTGVIVEALERIAAAGPKIAGAERERIRQSLLDGDPSPLEAAFRRFVDHEEAADCALAARDLISERKDT